MCYRIQRKSSYSGHTNNRLVRGDTSESFTDVSILLRAINDQVPAEIEVMSEDEAVGFFDRTKMDKGTAAVMCNISLNQPNNAQMLDKYQIDVDRYQLYQQYYTEDTGLWTSVYSYTINGLPTNDSVVFMTNMTNELVSYVHINEGAFDHFTLSQEEIEQANGYLNSIVNEAGIEEYFVVERRLVMNDGALGIRFSVQYTENVADELIQVIDDFFVVIN